MGKIITRFVCKDCGYESAKWLGRCPGCGNWNCLLEESGSKRPSRKDTKIRPVALSDIPNSPLYRLSSGIGELDRVLGGGIVPGSLITWRGSRYRQINIIAANV
jgi:DNA repair protein RadA/Sms